MRSYPAGEFRGVEAINSEGSKQTFGAKGTLVLGNDLDPTLRQLVVEGWATAATLLRWFRGNAAVYVAFGKGRLEPIALEIERHHPTREIVLCRERDDDSA
jgi:phage/plasmid primase-like uncharacterized protein